MIRHILFPVDFSASCLAVADVVRTWAGRFQARVTLLHVLDTPGLFAVGNPDFQSDLDRLRAHAQSKLDAFLASELAGLTVDRVLVEGSAASSIVDYASSHAVDLILMPTTGHTRFRQMLLGSVTASVLHDSPIPVWTSAHTPTPSQFSAPTHIVCAVDCGPETANVLRYSLQLAKEFGTCLTVVHSRPVIDKRFDSSIAQRAHQFALTVAQEDYDAQIEGIEGAPALEIVQGDSLAGGIEMVVQREHAELLVIGRGRSQGFLGRLRTNAHDLIRQSSCPVLSI